MPRSVHRRSRMVAVAGGKGGCGKTTTALGVALGLVRWGRRPLVADADVDVPDLHIRAGVDREPGLSALVAGERPVRVGQPSPAYPGVDVIATGSALPPVEAALWRLSDLDRPILVDCPAGAGPDAAAPLRVADATILVTSTAPASRQDAAKTARMAEALDAPPIATVVRPAADDTASDDAPDVESVVGGRDRRLGRASVITVPDVASSPLSSVRVRDRFHAVAGNLFE